MSTLPYGPRGAFRVPVAAMLCAVLAPHPALAEALAFSTDGWHTWRVEATQDAPDWCCVVWRNDEVIARGCELDAGAQGYGVVDSAAGSRGGSGIMQIYLKTVGGQPQRIRALAAGCSVSAASGITDHGRVDTRDSLAWLARHVSPRNAVSSDALAAIAVHAGDDARVRLVGTARADSAIENRKDALFWMGQVRVRETAGDIEAMMFRDPLAEIREHAAFSLSQSTHPGRAAAIGRLAANDGDAGVRGKAWFWLVQSAAADAAATILAGLPREGDPEVRAEAIFALSQLEDEQAVDALIAVIEHQRLQARDRERALFWMAQSDSDRAMSYLSALLDSR